MQTTTQELIAGYLCCLDAEGREPTRDDLEAMLFELEAREWIDGLPEV